MEHRDAIHRLLRRDYYEIQTCSRSRKFILLQVLKLFKSWLHIIAYSNFRAEVAVRLSIRRVCSSSILIYQFVLDSVVGEFRAGLHSHLL
jgi:hypothetical protein